jgi:hypothetical protein
MDLSLRIAVPIVRGLLTSRIIQLALLGHVLEMEAIRVGLNP